MTALYDAISKIISQLVSIIPNLIKMIDLGIDSTLSFLGWIPTPVMTVLGVILGAYVLITILRTVL